MEEHEQASFDAVFYDGASSQKRRVSLRFAQDLEIVEDGAVIASWPFANIRRADNPRALRLRSLSGPSLARLDVEDTALAQRIIEACPTLEATQGASHTLRIVGWSLAAVCSIVAVTVFGIPLVADRLAPLVPLSIEKRIGEAVDKQVGVVMGRKVCTAPEGQAAFTQLVGKIASAGGLAQPPAAQVLSSKVPNAFALPGGKIYLLDGLIQKAENVDEVAGVIAHELGHVAHRDSLRKVIQTGGTSFLIGLLFGDLTGGSAVIFAGRSILDASYSREAETAADDFAVRAMHGLGRSPQPMGKLLVRVTGSKSVATIIDSHPVSSERLARMAKDDRPVTGPELLDARQWQALKTVCETK